MSQREGVPNREKKEEMPTLDELEAHIGHRFKDRSLLEAALTIVIQLNERAEVTDAFQQSLQTQKRLETLGDSLFNSSVDEWTNQLRVSTGKNIQTGRRRNRIQSNLYLSVIGMRLGVDRFVSATEREVHEQETESRGLDLRIRLVANATEALMGAIYEDGGEEAYKSFLNAHVLPSSNGTTLAEQIAFLNEGGMGIPKLMRRFDNLVDGKAQLHIKLVPKNESKEGESRIIEIRPVAGKTEFSPVSVSGNNTTGTVRQAIWSFLEKNPWVLWGFDGPTNLAIRSGIPTVVKGGSENNS